MSGMGLRGFRFFNMKNIDTQARTFLKLNALSIGTGTIYCALIIKRLKKNHTLFYLQLTQVSVDLVDVFHN